MAYLLTVPNLLRNFFGDVIWEIPATDKVIYLTFDDGPFIKETQFVLDELDKHNAKATFFCIGKNVTAHPELYSQILQQGHITGNHTYNHLNGWKTDNDSYYNDIEKARKHIGGDLFRPPYGKITRRQVIALKKRGLTTIMWTAISADFDNSLTPQKCFENVMKHAKPGAIIVFHDSAKASKNLRYALPKVLDELSRQGYSFQALTAHNNSSRSIAS